jgi:UDP-2-acetamido-3-amino-2,3-dideoxy-glucuronate N-acetyltransferase
LGNFANFLTDLESRGEPPYFVHPSAIVDEPVEIGEGTRVHHFCHISAGSRLGKRCVLGQNVFVASNVTLGDEVRVQNNVSLYEGVTIEDLVFLGPSVVFTNITNPRAEINRRGKFEPTRVCRGATIGANATILCGVTIGAYAFVGAGSVVTKDVPSYSLVLGVPARKTGWMSRHGQKLGKPNSEGIMICPESGLRYRRGERGLECLDLNENASLATEGRVDGKSYIRSKL